MPPQFLGNPYEKEDEWGDSDLDLNGEEEWITIQDNLVITEGREGQNLIVSILESDNDILSTDTDEWLGNSDDEDYNPDNEDYITDENTDDEDYNPDDEDYGNTEDIQQLVDELNNSEGSSSTSFYGLYDDDDEDEEIDYVTYPLNDNEAASDNNGKATESNSNNWSTTDRDTD